MARAKIRHSSAWVTITDEDHRNASGTGTHKIDDLIQGDDNTDLNASVARHGLLPKLSGISTEALRGDGSWGEVSGGAGGGGGGGSSLLAFTAYNPVTEASYVTTTTLADMDATNLKVTFRVPANGEVLIRLSVLVWPSSGTGTLIWGLRLGGTLVGTEKYVAADFTAADTFTPSAVMHVTGLDPGDTITLTWAARHLTNAWTHRWGQTNLSGPATMEVAATEVAGELLDPQPGTGTYDATVLAHADLIDYWPLDEGGGTTANDAVGAFDGTVVTAAHVVMGVEGTTFDQRACAYFTGGTGARISMGTTLRTPTAAFSLEIWIKGEHGELENTSLLGAWGTANGAMLFPTGGGIHLHVTAQSTCQWTPGFPYFTDGLWHHIVGTFDGSTARLYVDGALRSATAYVATGAPTGTVPFEIGAYSNGSSAEYGGYVAAAALYDAAISDADVLDHYERGTGDSLVGGPAVNQGIDALTDVDTSTTTPDEGQSLVWDDASGLWVPRTVTGVAVGEATVGARVYGSADLTPGASPYVVLFNSERYDTNAFHDTGSNTSRLTVPAAMAGKYLITGHLNYNANPAGVGRLDIRLNGSTILASHSHDSGAGGRRNSISTVYDLAVGDYVELVLTNASLDVIDAEANGSPEFTITRLVAASPLTIPNLLQSVKSAADTPDDEFELTSLAGKWTAVAGTVGTVDLMRTTLQSVYDLSTRSGWLLIQGTVQLRQDYTLPDNSSIVMPVQATPAPGGDNLSIGIYLNTDDAAPGTGPAIICYLEQDTTTWDAQVTAVATATGGATLNRSHESPQILFIRVARSGTTYAVFISGDGYSWAYVGAGVSATLLTNLWIVAGAESTFARLPIIAIPWFRQGTNNLDPWPIT